MAPDASVTLDILVCIESSLLSAGGKCYLLLI
jgi:hypothetical protein